MKIALGTSLDVDVLEGSVEPPLTAPGAKLGAAVVRGKVDIPCDGLTCAVEGDVVVVVGVAPEPGRLVVDAVPLVTVVGAAVVVAEEEAVEEAPGATVVNGATPSAKFWPIHAPLDIAVGRGASPRHGASGSARDPCTHCSNAPVSGNG